MYKYIICFLLQLSPQSSAAHTLFSSDGFIFVGVEAAPAGVWIIIVAVVVPVLAVALVVLGTIIMAIIIKRIWLA